MTALGAWLLALAFGVEAVLCALLASYTSMLLLFLDLDAITRPHGPLSSLRPRWTAQRLMWRVASGLTGGSALALVGVALHWW